MQFSYRKIKLSLIILGWIAFGILLSQVLIYCRNQNEYSFILDNKKYYLTQETIQYEDIGKMIWDTKEATASNLNNNLPEKAKIFQIIGVKDNKELAVQLGTRYQKAYIIINN